MKRQLLFLAILGLLSSCAPEVHNQTSQVATAIQLNKKQLTLEKGENYVLTVTFTPSDVSDKTLIWVSSDKNVVEVTDGIVVGTGPGITEVIVKHGNLTDRCEVTVVAPAKSIKLDKSFIGFSSLGQSETLVATVLPSDATDNVKWTSSDTDVAIVSSEGVVTSISPGEASITAKCGTVADMCSVSVSIAATSITLNKNTIDLFIRRTEHLIATVEPSNTTDRIEWYSSNERVVTVNEGQVTPISVGTAIISAKAGEQIAECTVHVVNKPVPNGAVDLGLSAYWATCNLGAAEPEEYGDYYAWGETEVKSIYNWSTYKWCNGSPYSLTKYNTNARYGDVDNLIYLEPEDDAASVKLGQDWHMPSLMDIQELINECTWEWAPRNGVIGIKVTSKINGNAIFLPATGCRVEERVDDAAHNGGYWIASTCALKDDTDYFALHLYFLPTDDGGFYFNCTGTNRYDGRPIRPVSY